MQFSLTTFLFETANFLVLLWILTRIVYRPLRNGIVRRRRELSEREKLTAERLEEAEAKEEKAERGLAELEHLRAETMRDAMEQGAEVRARLLEQAREDAASERARVQRLLDAEREAARAWVQDMAVNRSTDLAGRLLLDLAPDSVDGALFERMLDELGRHVERLSRFASAVASEPVEVEVSFPRVPPDERLHRLRVRLTELMGRGPNLVLREEPELEAGLVLRAGHWVFDASLAGQLKGFRDRARELLESGEQAA